MNYKKFKEVIIDALDQRGPTQKGFLMLSLQKYACDSTFDKSFNELVAEGHLQRIHVRGQYRSRDVISLAHKDLVMTEPVKPLPPVPSPQTYTYVQAVVMMVIDKVSVSVPGESTPCQIQDGKIMCRDVDVIPDQLFVLTDEYPYTQDEAIDAWLHGRGIENRSSTKIHRTSDNDMSWLTYGSWKIHP
jgi:hypothetical protein